MNRIKKGFIFLIVIAVALFFCYKYVIPKIINLLAKDTFTLSQNEPVLGTYYLNNFDSTDSLKTIRQCTVKWNAPNNSFSYASGLKALLDSGAPLLITLEVWPNAANRLKQENILETIVMGDFDKKILSLCDLLKNYPQSILLRLNPEMEVYVKRYPWQMQSSELYIKSFRHIADIIKINAASVKMVWAPAGYPGADEYWPGNKWVDYISTTLRSHSESMTTDYPFEKSLTELIKRKLIRLRFFDKPVILLGSEYLKNEKFTQQNLDTAAQYLQQNKEIVYKDLNAADKLKDTSLLLKNDVVITGVYDPGNKLVENKLIAVEHVFVNLHDLQDGNFVKEFSAAIARKHDVIVTMEPWKDKHLQKDPELMQHILEGMYDKPINEMVSIITKTDKKIYLRWLHEMEIPITRYPWQSQDPVMYIKAYRYFVNLVRQKNATNIFYVWGPAGDRGSMEFWPGSDVVDFISMAIYGLPDKNITDHKKQESFNTIFNRKYNRLRFAGKPLFITEFGVKGPEDYKQNWMKAAAESIIKNKEIIGINYFNYADSPKTWGDIEAPDWSITTETFEGFLKKLSGKTDK